MQIFKTKWFHRWAAKEMLSKEALLLAVEEILNGLIDADLGGFVIKKRVAVSGRGKRSGLRTLVAFNFSDKLFFVYGFAKNERADITLKELKALKKLAMDLLAYRPVALEKAIEAGELIEACNDG